MGFGRPPDIDTHLLGEVLLEHLVRCEARSDAGYFRFQFLPVVHTTLFWFSCAVTRP